MATATFADERAEEEQAAGRPANYWLGEIDVARLKMDPDYQRSHETPAMLKRIAAYAANYDEIAAEVITASDRGAEGLFVISGGTRFLSARKAGRRTITAKVWTGIRAKESRAFLAIGYGTVRPGFKDFFRAELDTGDHIALAIVACARRAGVLIDLNTGGSHRSPDVVRAVGTLRSIYILGGDGLLDQTFRSLRTAWPDERGALSAPPLGGVAGFIYTYEKHPLYRFARIAAKLAEMPVSSFLRQAREFNPGARSSRDGEGSGLSFPGARRTVLAAYNVHLPLPSRLPEAAARDFKALSRGLNPWIEGAP